MTEPKRTLTLRVETLKRLRLWCALYDLDERDSLASWIRSGCRDLARRRGDDFLAGYDASLAAMGWGAEQDALPEGGELINATQEDELADARQGLRRTTFRLDERTYAAIRTFALLAQVTRSKAADMAVYHACRRWILHWVAQESEEWRETFLAAVALCRWPEDKD